MHHRDRGATLGLRGTVSDSILGGTRHFFLLILYNFKNIGGHVPPLAPPAAPRSLHQSDLSSPNLLKFVKFKAKNFVYKLVTMTCSIKCCDTIRLHEIFLKSNLYTVFYLYIFIHLIRVNAKIRYFKMQAAKHT